MADFAGRPVLVTGAGGGIGAAIVRRLTRSNARVLAADIHPEHLDAIVDETGAAPLVFDVAQEDSVRGALDSRDVYGVVNCAGFGGAFASATTADLAVFDRLMAVNARGALLVIKYTAPTMIRAGRGGSIVNISSQAALVALEGHISYAASKAALDSITRSCARELGPHRIRVNSVNPTAVMTAMSVGYWTQPQVAGPFLAAMPLGRWATEDDGAGPVEFLLSDKAGMVTGVTLPIDGGYTIQ